MQSLDDLYLNLEPTDLVKLGREVVQEHQHNTSRHELVLEAPDHSVMGQFDGPRLERVLDNLLGNAVKYSPEGGCVRLQISAGGDSATVVVQDQGLGIPVEDLPHVFEPFRRGGNVVGRITGIGIGLASAQRIVERHGGTLTVESTPGQGSTFTIRLPLSADESLQGP